MLRLLAKAGIASSAVLGVTFTSDSLVTISSTRQDKTNSLKEKIKEINSKQDIEIYEKAHGCTFLYSVSWDRKEVYRFKEFLKKESDQTKQLLAIDATRKNKQKCLNNKVVAFFYLEQDEKKYFHTCGPKNKPNDKDECEWN